MPRWRHGPPAAPDASASREPGDFRSSGAADYRKVEDIYRRTTGGGRKGPWEQGSPATAPATYSHRVQRPIRRSVATYSWKTPPSCRHLWKTSPEHERWSAYPSLTYTHLVFVFIETKLFSRLAEDHLSDEEYKALQQSLIANPEAGDLIRGSGGLRKLRWRGSGRGKRGGLRIIYYLRTRQGEIWLLTLYPKNVADDISPKVLRKIKEEIDGQE